MSTSHRPRSTFANRALTPALLAFSALALAGCGMVPLPGLSQDESPSAESSSSAASKDKEDSGESENVRKKDSTPSAEPSESASASASADASASASKAPATAAEPAEPPAGSQTMKGDTALISFAVPDNWTIYDTVDQAAMESIAAELNTDLASIQRNLLLKDAVATYLPGNETNEMLLMTMVPFPTGLKDEATLTSELNELGYSPEFYAEVDTANGKGSYMTATDASSNRRYALIYLPDPQGRMVHLQLYTYSTERAQDLVNTMASTLR
ncbi:hypothetical protein ACSL103130_08880 [Actinomyces slackii]|uniref:Uncharacterized protein n=1 Tax=Actinomyces slackii TaxID=52774 RepID=A0A3S4SDK6_9ACTO|nr:hypothetical protein [Actinomyces slackii]VEG73614.1 Uncharacterised protein [Actinomyces slackii]